MNTWYVLFAAFLFIQCSKNIYPSEYLFHSSFENGISCLAESHLPGAKKITVIPNDNPNQWPDTGFGVIGHEVPDLEEFFHYRKRKGNVFI
ncbi:MAG: hypothetical protein ABIA63_01765 [bacterium]